jgi:hypothetical protein
MIKHLFNKYILFILLSGALIVGLNTYKTYGVSWDEGGQRTTGLMSYNYLFNGSDSLRHFDNAVYGVGFELPLIMVEKTLHLTDSRDIFLMRHLLTHLFFLLGALAFFLLIDYLYHNKLLATIGFLLLVLNPLIYGHSFFNTKDIPFLSMFIICFLFTAIAFNKNKILWYIILGASCGLLTNMRIMGVLLIGCIWILFALDFLKTSDKGSRKKIIICSLVFTLAALLVLYATWPFLYNHPIKNFALAFKRMSKYPWEGLVLFGGKIYKSTQVPQYYGITWFSISNPLLYLGLGCMGLVLLAVHFLKGPKSFIQGNVTRMQLLFLFCFAEPLLAVFALHSVLYDSWRQLYFIYPPFILIAIYGLDYLLKTKAQKPVLIILLAGIGYTGFYMIKNYPYEHVYFNELLSKDPPEHLRKNFEMDYWGTSYKAALEYILKTDTAKQITVNVNGAVGKENAWILPNEERNRICFVDSLKDAKYFATYYRAKTDDYPFENKEVFSIRVLNSRILSVFKLK